MPKPNLSLAALNLNDLNEALYAIESIDPEDWGLVIPDTIVSYADQDANLVFASPATAEGEPAFRSLVIADLPGSIPDTKLATIATAGKVSDSALSANVALENAAQTWTQKQTMSVAPEFTLGHTAYGRTPKEGEWSDEAFDAGDFTAGGGATWTVEEADVVTNRYTLIGKTMIWALEIEFSAITVATASFLAVTIPGGKAAAHNFSHSCQVTDNLNGSAAYVAGTATGTTIQISRADGANFALSASNTYIKMTISFEIQ